MEEDKSDDESYATAFIDDEHIDQLKLKLRNLRDSMTSAETEFMTRNLDTLLNPNDTSFHHSEHFDPKIEILQLEQQIDNLQRKLSEKRQSEEKLRQHNLSLREQIKLLNQQIAQLERMHHLYIIQIIVHNTFSTYLELKNENYRSFIPHFYFVELCKTLQNHNEELQQKNLSLLTEHSIETLKHQQEVDKLNEIIKGHRTSHFELSKMNDELHEQFVQVQEMLTNFKRRLQLILNSKESDRNKIIAISALLEHGTHLFIVFFEKNVFVQRRERREKEGDDMNKCFI
jgi:TolA-binding protein